MLARYVLVIKKILFSDSFKTLVLRGFGVLFVFILSFLITNNFTVNEVGQYEFFRVFILLIGSICLLGTEISIIYFAGKFKALNDNLQLKNIYYKILKVLVLSSISINIIFFLFFKKDMLNTILNEDVYSLTKKIFLLLPFYIITVFNTETLRAIDRPILSEFFRNIFKFFSVLLCVVLFTLDINYISITEYFIYGFIPLFFVSQLIISLHFKNIKSTNEFAVLNAFEIVKTSFPMGMSNVIMFLLLSVDVFLLKIFYGNTVVAYYAIAIKLVTILSMVILSFNINISSEISLLYTNNKLIDLEKLCKKTAKIIFGINFIISLVIVFFLDFILRLFGNLYTSSKSIFYVLLISQLFTSFFGAVPVYLNMTGRAKVYQKILLLTLFLNVFLNYIFIPKYGSLGAAVILTFSVLFYNTFVFYYVLKKDKVSLSIL